MRMRRKEVAIFEHFELPPRKLKATFTFDLEEKSKVALSLDFSGGSQEEVTQKLAKYQNSCN